MPHKQTSKQRNDKREKAKQRRREENFRLRDTADNPATTMPNIADGSCAALSLICLHDLGVGIPYETVLASVNGVLSAEMKARVRKLREDIVAAAAGGHEKCEGLLGQGAVESLPFDDVVYNSKHIIETLEMFKAVTLCDDGYLDWRAVMIGAELLKLDGFRIASSDNDGKLLSTVNRTESTAGIPMVRFYEWGHYEAVVVAPVSLPRAICGDVTQVCSFLCVVGSGVVALHFVCLRTIADSERKLIRVNPQLSRLRI